MEGITALKVEKIGNELHVCFVLQANNPNKCFVISDTDGNILIKGFLEETENHKISITQLKKGNYFIHSIDGEKLFFEPFSIA